MTGAALVLAAGLAAALPGTWAVAQDPAALVAEGRRLYAQRGCQDCHTIGPVGTPIGPDLRQVGGRYSEAELVRWLRDPAAQEPTRHMRKLGLPAAEVTALAAYLASLR